MQLKATKLAAILSRLNSALRVPTALALFAALGLCASAPLSAAGDSLANYTLLECIETTGDDYASGAALKIDQFKNGKLLNYANCIETKVRITDKGTTGNRNNTIFCQRTSGANYSLFGINMPNQGQDQRWRLDYGSAILSSYTTDKWTPGTDYRLETTPNRLKIDDVEKTDTGATSLSTTTDVGGSPLMLFASCDAANPADTTKYGNFAKMRMYYFRVYSDNNKTSLVLDLVPVKNSSGVVGMYDRVNGVFYPSATGTAFTAGPDVDPSTLTFLERLAFDPRRVSADVDARASGGDIVLQDGDDYIHIFTATGTSTFIVKENCTATALLVGGGGGGGNNVGGGGGGGGVTEVSEAVSLDPGSLAVIVGAGGAAATGSNVGGTAGGTSSVAGTYTAVGGTGGYGWNSGDNSYKGGTAGAGGGNGGNAVASAAGQPGLDGTLSVALGSGQYFGGGGGAGAHGIAKTHATGGNGGGGGGSAPESNTPSKYMAESGEDGLGGGGGGGAGGIDSVSGKESYLAGARGGNGIVIIRVSAPLVTPVARPTRDWTSKTYNKTNLKPSYTANDGYQIVYSADSWVNAGSYTVTFTLNEGYEWADGDNKAEPITYTFTIEKKQVSLTWGTSSFVCDGQPHAPTCTAVNLVDGDTCNVTVTGAQSAVGTHTATATGLTGANAGNYQLPSNVTCEFTVNRTFIERLANDPRKVTTGFESYATGGDIILKEGDEYIHVFTNGANFKVVKSGGLTARVLLVAGGGSSGSPEYGSCGGGGAGGMVYSAAATLSHGDHSVTVGKGGVASNTGTGSSGMTKYGQNGGNSSLVGSGLTAIGGGRGAENAWGGGNAVQGGSGGGSGYASGAPGNGTPGQGNKGGDNDANTAFNGTMSGGGGGAGSPGHDFGDTCKYRWALGGDGLNCDILGFNQVFAGGGAGATVAMTDIPGGIGGGGSWSYDPREGECGEDGLGGGASGAYPADGVIRGGNGIVVVRYSTTTLAKKVLVPDPIEGLVYTGWEQTGVPAGKGYVISGKSKATNAGTYTATVALSDADKAAGYTWEDGSTADKQIEWTIAPYDLSTSRGLVFGAKDMMAMGATVTPTWNFVLNTATIGSSQWEVGDWDGAFVNPGTYHGKLRPSATGTNFTGERDITFTIRAAVGTYYMIGTDGTEYSSFNGVSTKTGTTDVKENTVGWSTEPNGAVDVDHKVRANFDYVIPNGASIRNPRTDTNHEFTGASLEVRTGGSLNFQNSPADTSDLKWQVTNFTFKVRRLIFNGGNVNDTNDGKNWAVEVEDGFEIRSGGAVFGLTAQSSRYLTLVGDLTRYEAGGNLTVRTTHTGDNGYTRSLAIDGDWSKFAGDIVAEPVVKSPARFYLGVAGAFGGKVQSLPPVRNVNESYIVFNYDKLRSAQRGLEVNTNDLSAVSLLKTRLWLTTSKAATTKNLPIMTFPAGTTVTPSQFTGVRVIPSYTLNAAPTDGTVLGNMGTRTNDDGTITLYANYSNNIADFDVTCPSQVYTGSKLTPVVTVKLAGRTLVEGTDYTIGTWSGGLTQVGDYTATITGLGVYEGTSTSVTFTITASDLVDLKDHITVTSYDGIYDGNPHTVTIALDEMSAGAMVKFGLTDGVYDLNAAPNPTLPYEATVYYQVTKDGCTTATGSVKLRITALQNTWNGNPSISKSEWTAGDAAGTVTGATTKYGNVRSYLQLHGTSVSNLWSYAMPQVPGVYTLYFIPEELPGVNPPDPAAKSLSFTIKGAMPSLVTAQSQVYTGEPIAAPAYAVIFTVPGKGVTRTLVKGVDFDEGTWSGPLTDGQMINAGVYTLTLTGKNPYTGSTTVSFTIEKAQNDWTQLPSVTPETWTTTDAFGTLTPGKTKFGAVTATYTQDGVAKDTFPGLAVLAASKAKGTFVVTYTAPATDANVIQPTEMTKTVSFTITQGEYTYGKYETLSAAGGAYVVVADAAIGADEEVDKKPVEATAYANSGADLWMFHNATAPVAATFNHFRILGTGGQLLHNLVPARRDDNVDGFYDTVTKEFFANAAQGATLTAANAITPEVAIPELAANSIRETGAEIDILAKSSITCEGLLVHGTTKATEPDTYTFTLTPDDAHVWAGGTFATRTYTWTITEDAREEVAKPYALDPPAQYNGGNAVNGIAYDSALLGTRYAITGDGTSATAAGSYHSTATLLDPDSYRWLGTHDSVLEIDWEIAKGANEWTTPLSLPSSWEPGQPVAFTQPIAKFGTAQASLKRPGSDVFAPWSSDFSALTENGDYQVRFAVAEDTNWTTIEVVQNFRIKDGTMKDDIVAENVEAVYDGEGHGLVVSLEGSAAGATLKFWNVATSAYDLDASPTQTDVGVLEVKYQVSKTGKVTVTDSRTVTVIKRTPVVSGTAVLAGWTEGDEGEHVPSGCTVTPSDCGTVVYGYYADAACTRRFAGQPVAAGTYYVRGEVAEGETWFAAASMPATAFTIASADPDGVPLPKLTSEKYDFTGSPITPTFEATEGYTTDGATSATAIGTHTITCTLEPGKHWVGGSTAPYDLQWEIVAKETFLQKLARDPRRVNGAGVTNYNTGYAVGGDLVLFDSETSEYIHVFTNTSEIANFTPSQNLNARVLLVGGGGAGNRNCGGGGGGGGVIEADYVQLAVQGYAIQVGAGQKVASNVPVGDNGGDSSISALGLVAGGGGKGGGYDEPRTGTAGLPDGGNGGGSLVGDAGAGAVGGGHSGGRGDNVDKAGGGGGAGADGGSPKSGVSQGGKGGDGLLKDILGFDQYFGGGGGGSGKCASVSDGGLGGGGIGSSTSTAGTAGENGLGGGGGGGGSNSTAFDWYAHAGGDGIVIIRYAAPNASEVAPVPASWLTVRKLFTNGKTQIGVEAASYGSTLSGDYYGDVAGTYTAIATLAPGYTQWEDGETASSRPIVWKMLDYTRLEYIDNGSDPAKAGYVPLTGFKPKKDQAIAITFSMNKELDTNTAQMLFAVQYLDDVDTSCNWQWSFNYTHHGAIKVLSYTHGKYSSSTGHATDAYVPITNPDSVCVGGIHNAVLGRTLTKMSIDGKPIEHSVGSLTGDALNEFPHDFGNDLVLFCSSNAEGNSFEADGKVRVPALAKIYGFTVMTSEDDPTPVLDLVPVTNTDGVRGFYDLVSGNFYPLRTPVVLDGNGGTPEKQYVYSVKGEAMPAMPAMTSLPTRSGYDFKGYFSAATGGTQYYDANGKAAVSACDFGENTTLYAQWDAVKYHVINPETGPEIAVDRTWLEGAFEGGKTKEQYQQDLFTTNASGVVAWQAYVLGFGAANWSSAALVEETVQNADPATVTIQLKDLPSERPEDTGCTVKYSLYASPSTDVLLAGGGTVVTNDVDKDAVKEYYKWPESTFEAPLDDLSDDVPVLYYRIKVHFTFGGVQ